MSSNLKHREKILNEVRDLSEDQINSVIKIIRIFKESIDQQKKYDFGLKREFEEWDKLSDEAMLNFETNL